MLWFSMLGTNGLEIDIQISYQSILYAISSMSILRGICTDFACYVRYYRQYVRAYAYRPGPGPGGLALNSTLALAPLII